MIKKHSIAVLVLVAVLLISFLPVPDTGVASPARISGVNVIYFKPSQINTRSTIKLEVDINEYLPIHSWIKIIFPDEWTMPKLALPSDKNMSQSDKKELERIVTSLYLGTSPCTACQGLPYVRHFERDKENSIQFWTHLELKPDGPYDPIPITVASRAGFVNSKIPGSYQICVATEEESTAVCSQNIEVVESQVEPAQVTLTNEAIGELSGYNIKFKVGAGGSLDARRSNIKLRFPKGTKLPVSIEPTLVKVNGKPLSVDVNVHQPSSSLSFVIPVDVASYGEIEIVIPERASIINTEEPGTYSMVVSTTYEPTWVESVPFDVKRAGQKPVVIPPYTSQIASYKFAVYVPKSIEKNDLIEITFPSGTTIPRFISASSVLMNEEPCELKPRTLPDENKIQLYSPTAMQKGSIMVKFLDTAKLVNPSTTGEYIISFKTQSSDELFKTDPYDIFIKKTDINNIKVTPLNASTASTWIIDGSTSFSGDLKPGDTIALTFPDVTTIPPTISNSSITIDGVETTDISVSDNKITLTIANKIPAGGEFHIIIKPDSGIKNPSETGDYKLKISTTKDPAENDSVEFFIAPPLPKTTLLINPPEPDGKNGWFKNAPAIDFDCTSDTATVFMWWNWKEEQKMTWGSEGWQPMADEQRIDSCYYYAEDTYGIETVNEYIFKIDTVAPTFTITKPIGGLSDNATGDTYIIEGTADATEMFVFDDEEKSMKVVPNIFVNGKQGKVIQPPELGLEETTEGEGDFRFEVAIDEGENIFTILAEDEAGNTLEKSITITKDTIAPTIEITSPEHGVINHCDEIEIKGKTEAGVVVTINGDFVDVAKDGTFVYDYTVYDLKKIKHDITYSAEDIAGNKSGKKEYTVWFGSYTVIPTTGSQPTVNNAESEKDFSAYVSKEGKTLVPFRYLAENLMEAEVGWDAATRTASITSTIPPFVIKHKIGTKYFTKTVNGKSTRIDMPGASEIKNGNTYLPMREFLEGGLGLPRNQIGWNAATRTVTVSNPGNLDKCE